MEGTKKFSTQRLKREGAVVRTWAENSFPFKRALYREEESNILGVLFNAILKFTFSTIKAGKQKYFIEEEQESHLKMQEVLNIEHNDESIIRACFCN